MTLRSILRHCLVWQWTLAVLSVTFFQLEKSHLPFMLQQFAVDEAVASGGTSDVLVGWLTLAWLLGSLAASGGAFVFRRWARPLFLLMAVLGCALAALVEPAVSSPASAAAETAAQMLVGLIVGLLYFSPLRDQFGRPA
jgi:membrane associated rhomboid family serine protease